MRKWLLAARKAVGMTQEEVANRAQIRRAYYTMVEAGVRTPSVTVAKRIASALGIEWTLFFDPQCNETLPMDETSATLRVAGK